MPLDQIARRHRQSTIDSVAATVAADDITLATIGRCADNRATFGSRRGPIWRRRPGEGWLAGVTGNTNMLGGFFDLTGFIALACRYSSISILISVRNELSLGLSGRFGIRYRCFMDYVYEEWSVTAEREVSRARFRAFMWPPQVLLHF